MKKSEDVITVDELPDVKQSKPKKNKPTEKPTNKNTTQTKPTKAPTKKVTPQKASVVVTKQDVKKVKGPPTIARSIAGEEPLGSEYDPGNSNSDSDNSAAECTPRRGRT